MKAEFSNLEFRRNPFLPSIVVLLTSAALADATPSADPNVVQMEHWYSYYFGQPSPGSNPDLATLYFGDTLAPGMDTTVASEFARLQKQLPSNASTKLSGWSPATGVCTNSSPITLVALTTDSFRKGGKVCIFSLLLLSLFLRSVDMDMVRLSDWLKQNGLDPATFSSAYAPNPALPNSYTAADWISVIGAYGGDWKKPNGFQMAIPAG